MRIPKSGIEERRPLSIPTSTRRPLPVDPDGQKVWQAVRHRQPGFKIRRQHPIGWLVANFYCAETNLVIEIDGDSNAPPDRSDYDAERSRWLEERGYQVIRFSGLQVEEDVEGVVEGIREAGKEGVQRRNEQAGGHDGDPKPTRCLRLGPSENC